jgi:hypothetical protein
MMWPRGQIAARPLPAAHVARKIAATGGGRSVRATPEGMVEVVLAVGPAQCARLGADSRGCCCSEEGRCKKSSERAPRTQSPPSRAPLAN